ncbi:rod shape-determining protein MreD [Treponema sp.]|uniref:rod shape-determining protein MreD n=1 Tax=Treponema sp. TaxID=166 RepID=UPI00298E9FB2|nr:rod shape-determining protein MreD [Treponema sp.]MCR5613940.1 rod shape-determining protein MreD [Treponema sp.]
MLKSYLTSIFILIVAVLIETAILSNIAVLPAVPDLLLLCTLYFAICNGSVHGETTGFISGLFIDFLSGSPFGLNCLVRTVIGYLTGFFKKMLNLKSFFATFVIGFVGTLFKAIVIYIVSFFFPNMVNTYNIFTKVFLFELIFNSVLAPFIFKFLDCFSNLIVIEDKF